MFMGEYAHNIDKKGRIIIPAKFREELGDHVIITRGLDGCLAVYTKEQWETIYEQLMKLPSTKKDARMFVRMMTSKALNVKLMHRSCTDSLSPCEAGRACEGMHGDRCCQSRGNLVQRTLGAGG